MAGRSVGGWLAVGIYHYMSAFWQLGNRQMAPLAARNLHQNKPTTIKKPLNLHIRSEGLLRP